MNIHEMVKQNTLAEEYKLKKESQSDEYSGDFNSPHYTVIENAANIADIDKPKDNYSSPYKEDFDKASRDYWHKKTQNGISKYNAGSLTSNFGSDKYTLDEFLNRIGRFIKESISNEMIANGKTPEMLHENFKSIDISLRLLAKSVENTDTKISLNNIAAYIHGFINSYIANTVSKKLKVGDHE